MGKKTNYTDEIIKAGALIDKAQKQPLTNEEQAYIREVIWTITCKELVKNLLTDLPISQKELAEAINVNPSMITDYKKGRTIPGLPTLLMILSILHPETLNGITNGKCEEVNELLKSFGVNFTL